MPVLEAVQHVARQVVNDPTLPSVGRSVLLSLGPIYFSIVWNWTLLGMLVVQIYYYYLSFKSDQKWLKSLVATVLIFELIQTGMATHSSFTKLVLFFGNLGPSPITLLGLPLFDGLVGGMTQGFYAWRIWTLGRWAVNRSFLAVFVFLVCCVSLLGTICAVTGAFVYIKIDSRPGLYISILETMFTTWYSASIAADTLIAFAMVILISNAKTNTTFRKTNDFLSKILVLTVASGLVNAIVNALGIILFLTLRSNNVSEVPSYIIGKIYSNSLLVALNARRSTSSDSDAYTPPITSGSSGLTSSTPATPGGRSKKLTTLTFSPNFKVKQASDTSYGTGTMEVGVASGGSNERIDIQMQDMDKANESFMEQE